MKLKKYLKSLGYKIIFRNDNELINNFERMKSYEYRLKLRTLDNYPVEFEKFILKLIKNEFELECLGNVKILNEGLGGDYDVLAFTSSLELIYLECKTGKNISKKEIKRFYDRHLFLKPSFSVLVIDQKKQCTKEAMLMLRDVLTEWVKTKDNVLNEKKDYKFPSYEIIPENNKEYAYHIDKNLFAISGKNLIRGISYCFRYYNNIVKQSSYWG